MLHISLQYFGSRGAGGSGGARGGRGGGGGTQSGAASSKGTIQAQADSMAAMLASKSTPLSTKQAIQALGTDASSIRRALTAANSSEGYTSAMFQGANGAKLASTISKITGQAYSLETITTKGFMGYNTTKKVLKRS